MEVRGEGFKTMRSKNSVIRKVLTQEKDKLQAMRQAFYQKCVKEFHIDKVFQEVHKILSGL